jgi:hypothetical protein
MSPFEESSLSYPPLQAEGRLHCFLEMFSDCRKGKSKEEEAKAIET